MTKSEFRDHCRDYINIVRSFPNRNYDKLVFTSPVASYIHMDVLAEFTDLEFLMILNCNLKTLGSELSSLQKLRTLHISNFPFEEVPEVIFKLKNLTNLTLQNGKLKTVPRLLFEELQLGELHLRSNQIANLPRLITRNESLKKLDLGHNHIKKLPDGFLQNLPNLEEIELVGNPLSK
jgi:Leucine-rich repeat (LRR) protein